MTHQRPLPDAAVSPYPLHPEAHDEMREPAFFTMGSHHDEDDERAHYTFAERFSLSDVLSTNTIAIGAAIGLGVAAIAGALLYGRRKAEAPPARPARRQASRTAKSRTTKPRATRAKTASAPKS
jgi:hypothetical protein